MTTEQIFKLQKPLKGMGDILVYNRSRSIILTLPWPRDKQKKFFGQDYRVYAKGRLNGEDFEVLDKVPDQGW